MKLSDIRIDMDVVEAGEWVDNIPILPGIELFTRGYRNKDWCAFEGRLIRSSGSHQASMHVPAEYRGLSHLASDRITNSCLYETCLRDWRGFDEPYDSEKARKLIFEHEFRLFRDGVLWAAMQVGRRRGAAVAAIEPAIIEPVITEGWELEHGNC